ncbi:MAG: hypothetical protein SGJ17_08650 [Hyphomicrobiales bacterium]|nr:hypothetical protein [Hyphomicrobiales bacterium]
MQRLDEVAAYSVARGCGFAGLAIGTMMVGLSGDMPNALKAGGILTLLIVAVLLLKALNANKQPYKLTELWIMLEPDERPPQTMAQGIVSSALRRAYLRFARQYAFIAGAMLLGSLVLKLIRTVS